MSASKRVLYIIFVLLFLSGIIIGLIGGRSKKTECGRYKT